MSTSSQPYPSDPADLFLRLYAEMGPNVAAERADEWAGDQALSALAEYVESTVSQEGALDPEAVAEHFDSEDDPDRQRYGYLCGIDAAMALVHPAADHPDRGGLDRLAVRYRLTGRFNNDPADGALLPRFTRPDRFRAMPDDVQIEELADLFEHVHVASPQLWPSVEHSRIRRDLSPSPTVLLDGLIVGCAPVCDGHDIVFSCLPAPPRRRYVVQRPEHAATAGRIAAIVNALDASGAHAGVMPELTLDAELLGLWQEALRTTVPAPGSKLHVVLVGSGPLERFAGDVTANRAVLLTRRGRVLLEQDKRHPFTLTEDMIERWGLEPELGAGAAAEPIRQGTTLKVLETPFGRLTMLVCEDLGRLVEDGTLLRAAAPSLCLAPVLSKPTLEHYWEHSRAKELSAEIGSHVVIANSLVVEDRQRAAGTLDPDQLGTALAHVPAGGAVGHTPDPASIVLLRLHPDGAVVMAA